MKAFDVTEENLAILKEALLTLDEPFKTIEIPTIRIIGLALIAEVERLKEEVGEVPGKNERIDYDNLKIPVEEERKDESIYPTGSTGPAEEAVLGLN